jgi:CheY-like chemotaxis protein
VIGTAQSGIEAIEMVNQLKPDLVLMDIAMPNMDGLEATRRIKLTENPPRIIIVTFHDTPEVQDAATAAGADGFIEKTRFRKEAIPFIRKLQSSP